jgi:glycosyltransferase involved in cell wall biosynthesis
MLSLALSTLSLLVRSPVRWCGALATALQVGGRSDRGMLRHVIYFAEACHVARRLDGIAHLHAHFGTNSATVAMLVRLLGGPPFSFTVHGPEEFDKPEFLALGEKIRHCKFAVAISSFGRSQLYRWSRSEDWPKLHVVRCGVDQSFLGDPPTPVPDTQTVVSVGRLSEQKGPLVLVEAAAMLRDRFPGLRVVFAGDGPLRTLITDQIARRGLGEIVTITGWCSGAQVRDQLRRSRGLVLPSFAEGLPVVIMEAFALGRPVVTTYVAGIPELVRPGESGWLVPAGDAQELASALAEMLSTSTERLTAFGEAGRRAVQERHDITTEAGRLAELFQLPE